MITTVLGSECRRVTSDACCCWQELLAHVEEGMGKNLAFRCSDAVYASVQSSQRYMIGTYIADLFRKLFDLSLLFYGQRFTFYFSVLSVGTLIKLETLVEAVVSKTQHPAIFTLPAECHHNVPHRAANASLCRARIQVVLSESGAGKVFMCPQMERSHVLF